MTESNDIFGKNEITKNSKIVPYLWFDNNAEEAVNFYVSIFKDSKVGNSIKYGKTCDELHNMEEGKIMTIDFQIEGQKFVALNGGPSFRFTEAISFQVMCDTQEEIDYYWEKLSEGGDPSAQQCGWLRDKYSLSWQIVPTVLPKLLQSTDTERVLRVMRAMIQMKKFDIHTLWIAYANA